MVKTKIKYFRLQRWKPRNLCRASPNDLLVVLNSNSYKNTKVVRYSGSTEKQTIQIINKGKPLYSSGPYYRYINENKNIDIFMADGGARSVEMVSQVGELRFTYIDPPITTKEEFNPILTADYNNHCIHICRMFSSSATLAIAFYTSLGLYA